MSNEKTVGEALVSEEMLEQKRKKGRLDSTRIASEGKATMHAFDLGLTRDTRQ